MQKIDCIRHLLNDRYLAATGCKSVLKEQKNDMQVSVTGLPDHGFVFKVPEKGRTHIGTLSGEKGLKQSCDYLIFIAYNNSVDVYFIEMKKSLEDGRLKKACDQILCTVPVLRYLVSMVKVHFEIDLEVRMHFNVIAKKEAPKLSKQGVKPKIPEVHSHKKETIKVFHSAMEIPWQRLR